MKSSPVPLKFRFKDILNQMPYLPRAIFLVWQAARPWTITWLVLLLIQGLLPIATVYLTRALVDNLVIALEAGGSLSGFRQAQRGSLEQGNWELLGPTLVLVGAMAAVLLLTEALRSVAAWVRTAQAELVSDHIYNQIHAKAITLDLGFFETPAFYDQLHRARIDAISRPVALLENLGGLLQNGITMLAMAAVLLSFGPWMPLVLLVSTLPALFAVARYTLRFHRWRVTNTINERRTRYYDWLITWHESAAEIRLFALGDYFREAFQRLRLKLRTERVNLARGQAVAELAAGGIALLAMGGAMVWMVWQAVWGVASLGDLALFYQAFSQGQRLMQTLLTNAGEIYRNLFFLENLFEFLALEPEIVAPTGGESSFITLQDCIRLEKITFQYPGSQRVALQDFCLTVLAGQIVSIVGENGAGKSTLIKLLCRFYDPQAGRITFDGIDLRELSLASLRRQVTVLFQEPVHYHETVTDNIAYGDLLAKPDLARVKKAARATGADAPIDRLSKGYETVLGKWFGGAELSVGEWQRVALARAFLRQASLVILDEPTSAMDSWAEADWLARFREFVAGKTAIIITHRFTTAMQADVIHVMDRGCIIESGNHAELLALNGRYAQSWQQQMQETRIG
jgi:ATP-binding cassette subfamily B protein